MKQIEIRIGDVPMVAVYTWADPADIATIDVHEVRVGGVNVAEALASVALRTARGMRGAVALRDPETMLWDDVAELVAAAERRQAQQERDERAADAACEGAM